MTKMRRLRPLYIAIAALAAGVPTPASALLTITELKARAATNDPISCFELAWRYKRALPLGKPEEDLSVPKDMVEAHRWFHKAYEFALPAAKKGDHQFQDMLGRICLEGLDDTNRIAEGVAWRRKAAAAGNIHAQVDLGHALLNGSWGLERNENEAVKWLTQAAERRHEVPVRTLTSFYEEKGDYTNAAKWLSVQAQFGHGSAQSQLGQWYAQGLGVKRDNVEAYKWLSLAVPLPSTNRMRLRPEVRAWFAREEEKHKLRRDLHGALLTRDQMEQAKRKIADFKKTKTFHEEATDD